MECGFSTAERVRLENRPPKTPRLAVVVAGSHLGAMPRRAFNSVSKLHAQSGGCARLVGAITAFNTRMVGRVARVTNQALVLRNWMIGGYIVEYEQRGADRARYGARLLETSASENPVS